MNKKISIPLATAMIIATSTMTPGLADNPSPLMQNLTFQTEADYKIVRNPLFDKCGQGLCSHSESQIYLYMLNYEYKKNPSILPKTITGSLTMKDFREINQNIKTLNP